MQISLGRYIYEFVDTKTTNLFLHKINNVGLISMKNVVASFHT